MHICRNVMSLCTGMLLLLETGEAQPQLPLPEASQKASVSQTVGTTGISVTYHRPGVKGRTIWGSVVPYNEVWRAGANENTTIAFADPVRIEGKNILAGTYGLHMIPSEKVWTIIFSKNCTSWGSYFYKESEDALRVTVVPGNAEFQEWLSYDFNTLSDSSAVLALRWEKLRIPIRIDVDVKAAVLANARTSFLRGMAGFSWQGFNQAAAYCLRNNVNLSEALSWIDKSISINENFTNLRVKAGLLEKTGKTDESASLMERSLKLATEVEMNQLGYQLLGAKKVSEAIDVFKKNCKDHPDSWNVYDSLGEAYQTEGDMKRAVENYTKALSLVKDETNKKRITSVLEKLNKGK